MERNAEISGRTGKRRAARTDGTHSSTRRLLMVFWSWKCLLILIAVASPGPGYDTSTEVLLRRDSHQGASWLEYLVTKLTRWDGLYFASASERGLLYEQQWAFSPFLARVTSLVTRVLSPYTHQPGIALYALFGIAISHVAHLIAVILLFRLTYDIIPSTHHRKQQIAFTTACLHILSPAGLFLSAPYGESAFAMVHFSGLLCYARAQQAFDRSAITSCGWTITSGGLIGVATMVRSNGLLSGLMFALDAVAYVPLLPTILQQRDWAAVTRLTGTLIAGVMLAAGYVGPQLIAYIEYCTGGNDRLWCHKTIPSIYSFVQSHYWGVGFLQYWTMSNLPLFALAIPMLVVLCGTGYMGHNTNQLNHIISAASTAGEPASPRDENAFRHLMQRLALPQVILAILALTSFHVQIINRISSGYPTWYIVLAVAIHSNRTQARKGATAINLLSRNAETLVRTSVIYAVVQGGLYASFMPPA